MNSDPGSVDAREEHPDVEEISALSEGVLPADRSDDVRSHLAGCSLCTDVRDSLDEIRGMLGRLPGPPQMPADVAGRIDATLAAEALLASTTPSTGTDKSASPAAHQAQTAAIGSSRHPASTGPARGERSGPGRAERTRRRRWSVAVLGGVCGAAVLGLGAFFLSTAGSPGGMGISDSADTGASAEHRKSAAAHVYTDDTLASRVHDLLANTGKNRDLGAAQDSGKGSRSPLVAPQQDAAPAEGAQQLPDCILDATERPSETPLVTDYGEYQGKQVGVVVLPDRKDKQVVDVFLVDSSCANLSPTHPGTVLLERSIPRS